MWEEPVVISMGKDQPNRSVQTSIEALRVLDGWWQKVDGPAFQNAINVCIAAIRNETSDENARAAFVSALSEGGVVLLPVE
ncbi:DUF982 domain-containing protein [Falsirhodobacter xinxiangensis]|uniref:DUF982 domain-containing protein n=1 Tax=Falsirhodobacter xinxiangensis TaxID=2530049 RepID=UPI00145BB448|nr:DUF982 domain-containing protein [Rhodobacter xinxiangensis]